MIFTETKIKGAYVIELERIEDDRGFFARTFCEKEIGDQGLKSKMVQCSVSFNRKAGTLRGLHYQIAPHEEAKLVRCTRGAIYDVVVDLRRNSPTFKQWLGVELTEENRWALYVPEGCAHGFQTLKDNTEVLYYMSEFYHPECARGLRWNEPALGIEWPSDTVIISKRDSLYPDFSN